MCRVRELTTTKVGTLLHISGQVVHTHPVHPELVSGAFICLECQTAVPDVCDSSSSLPLHLIQLWHFLSLLPFIFPRFPHLSLLSFSPSPSYPTFHSPSMPSPYHLLLLFHPFYLADPLSFSPSPPPPPLHHPYWSYITLTHSTPPSTFHPSLLVFHFTLLTSSSTPSLSSPSPSHSSQQSANCNNRCRFMVCQCIMIC